MTVKRKLAARKRAEEKRILDESAALYDRLLSEREKIAGKASDAKAAEAKPVGVGGTSRGIRRQPMTGLIAACVAVVFAVCAAGILPFAFGGKKNETTGMPSQGGNAIDAVEGPVTVEEVNARLGDAVISDKLNFSSVTIEGGVAKLVANTFSSFFILVDFEGKREMGGFFDGSESKGESVGGLALTYSIDRREHEDCYEFYSRARLDGENEVFYVVYDYMSGKAECELFDLLRAVFRPKEGKDEG